MPFLDSLDIANSACQHLGVPRILTVDEDSKQNSELAFAYDKMREAELRRNTWRFAIKRTVLRAIDTDTLILNPALWDATITYRPGSIVKDDNGLLWCSNIPNNLANDPADGIAWDSYFGPMTVTLYDSTVAYFAGELVYKLGSTAGSYVVYASLQGDNEDDPSTATDWDADTTFRRDDVVLYSATMWRSKIDVNLGITPVEGPLDWDVNAIYSIGNTTTGPDGYGYTSATNSNQGNDPSQDGGVNWTPTGIATAWTALPAQYEASNKWVPLFCAAETLRIMYPIGSGPSTEQQTKNVYRLPANYLKTAPQDPKRGSVSWLGAPSGNVYKDWEYNGDYIVSAEIGPIMLRFVGDIQKVTDMDAMFCEGLACRMAFQTCEAITQSTSKQSTCAGAYEKFMKEARITNAIEQGAVEPEDDDYISCRV